MKITSFSPINTYSAQTKIQPNRPQNYEANYNSVNFAYPKNYYISFEGRVDKGLDRFYNQNIEYMPKTVKEYIEGIDIANSNITPLQAQQNAFDLLEICDTVEDVKLAYPDEPLFENLKSTSETKSKRGLLYDIKVMKDDLEETGETVAGKEKDFTMYLLKKVYLEGKTIGEINEDLDKDINPIFKREDKNYILDSTLSSLGIKLPKTEYLTSLRYTRDGYSDKIGQNISQAWQDLSDEEKFRRIEILTSNRGEISPEKLAEMKEKRSVAMKKFWQEMTPERRVEFIESMQSGDNDYQKLAMINAWNKCPEIRNEMSNFFADRNFYNPQNIIYRDLKYSEAMSNAMKEFWAQNPEYADILGDAIRTSYTEIDTAKENGTYDEYAKEILDEQKAIKAEMKAKRKTDKNQKTPDTIIIKISMDDILQKSPKEEYMDLCHSIYPFMPREIMDKCYRAQADLLSEEEVRIKVKDIKDEPLTKEEIKKYNIMNSRTYDFGPESAIAENAIKLAMQQIFADCLEDDTPYVLRNVLGNSSAGVLLSLVRMAVVEKQKILPITDKNGFQIENFTVRLKRIPSEREVRAVTEREYNELRKNYIRINGKI